jgi:uncharacterized protein (TIGR02285 family)
MASSIRDKVMKNRLRFLAFFFFISVLSTVTLVAKSWAQKVSILYNERPPYTVTAPDGTVNGLTADPVDYAFAKAGIPVCWESTPTKRQMAAIEAGTPMTCALGWFKIPDREKFAKFTVAIYQDKPTVALASSANRRIESGKTLESILENKDLVLLVKEGFSYGKFLDDKIKEFAPPRETTLAENVGMLEMIQKMHADYMFVAPEEANALIRSAGFEESDFKVITFSDITGGAKRYLMCSRQLPDEVLEKLNTGIKEYRGKNPGK